MAKKEKLQTLAEQWATYLYPKKRSGVIRDNQLRTSIKI